MMASPTMRLAAKRPPSTAGVTLSMTIRGSAANRAGDMFLGDSAIGAVGRAFTKRTSPPLRGPPHRARRKGHRRQRVPRRGRRQWIERQSKIDCAAKFGINENGNGIAVGANVPCVRAKQGGDRLIGRGQKSHFARKSDRRKAIGERVCLMNVSGQRADASTVPAAELVGVAAVLCHLETPRRTQIP